MRQQFRPWPFLNLRRLRLEGATKEAHEMSRFAAKTGSKTMQYKISAIVNLSELGSAIQALAQFTEQALDIEKIEQAPSIYTTVERRPRAPRNGPIMHETRGGKAILASVANAAPGTIFTTAELGEALATTGLKKASASSIASGLVREGKLSKISKGRFQMPKEQANEPIA